MTKGVDITSLSISGLLAPPALIGVARATHKASAEQIAAQARACLAVGDIEGASRLLSKLENQ
jgi:hypothetical protein